MLVIMIAIVRLASIFRGLQFGGQRPRPFLPGEVALLRELDREGEGLRLPGLGKNRTAFIAGKMRQIGKTLVAGITIACAQGSRPTSRGRQNRGETPVLPRARVPRSARSKHAAALRQETAHSYR